MTKTQQEIENIRTRVEQKIAEDFDTVLPMYHNIKPKRLKDEDREEWKQRQSLYRASHRDYDKEFIRPSEETTKKLFELLNEYGLPSNIILPEIERLPDICDEEDEKKIRLAQQQAIIIILHRFIISSRNRNIITNTDIFEALCKGFSDHYIMKMKNINSIRDMKIETVKQCIRDLLYYGLKPKELRDIVVKVSHTDTMSDDGNTKIVSKNMEINHPSVTNLEKNPIFHIDKYNTKSRGIERIIITNNDLLLEFIKIIKEDEEYSTRCPSGIKVLFKKPKNSVEILGRCRVSSEHNYNTIILKYESIRLINIQQSVSLYLDTDRFNDDYKKSYKIEQEAKEYLGKLDIDTSISDTIKFKKKLKTLNLKKDKKQRIPLSDRQIHIKEKLSQYKEKNINEDLIILENEVLSKFKMLGDAQRHQAIFADIYDETKQLTGFKKIYSQFQRLFTRRYQPVHLWPTYVSSKNLPKNFISENGDHDDSSEQINDSYRSMWFKSKDQETGELCDLAGYDISSSQMQIIAVFLGDKKFEDETMQGRPFKEKMADRAWEKHCSGEIELCCQGEGNYENKDDPRLRKLVKDLLMQVSYGSTAGSFEERRKSDPKTYGPGWKWIKEKDKKGNEKNTNGDTLFIKDFNKKFKSPKIFKKICQEAAEFVYKKNKYSGLFFKDPLDGAEVRWNPIERQDYHVGNYHIIISIPGSIINKSDPTLCPICNSTMDELLATRGPNAGKVFLRCSNYKNCNGKKNPRNIYEYYEPDNNGDYPVDRKALKKMAAPCLIHMLDAYYSSLVISKLSEENVKTFVGIHDCWLVPKKQVHLLKKAMICAAKDWYHGLEPIYKALLDQSEKDTSSHKKVEKAYNLWKERYNSGWVPSFLSQEEPK